MTNDRKNVPELRFPGFNGEWELLNLSKVLKDKSDGIKRGPFGGALKKEIFVSDGYAVYEQQNAIYDTQKFRYFITEQKFQEMKGFSIKENDIIMSCSGTIGKLSLIPSVYKKGIINQALIRFRTNNNILADYFLIYMRSNYMQRKILESNPGSAIVNLIPVKELKNLPFPLPNIKEQQKIGDFFSKLDRQIELEEQKLEKLEEQKKGYMQKLFSQELRFKTKDNVYYSEWKLHKLGEIFKYSQGQQISVDKQFSVKSNEMKRFIRIVDITENPEPRFVLYESDTGLVNKEDLFMIRYGRPGIVSIGFEGIIANNLFKLIPKIKISTVYFYYLLSYNYYRINLLTNQSTMPALNFKSLDLLKFKIPSYKEQNKIGNFFTKFDELIEKQNIKIDGLKERKKGLLQKMFV